MLPVRHSPGEISTAYFILIVPEWLKEISAYSVLGLLIMVPVYYSARLHKSAILTFDKECIIIKGNKIDINIPSRLINKVFFNDLHSRGRPKGVLQVVIQEKGYKSTTFRLIDYSEGDDIINELSVFKKIQFLYYENNMIGSHDDE